MNSYFADTKFRALTEEHNHESEFMDFQKCVRSIKDPELKAFSETLKIDHLETISGLLEACRNNEIEASKVEELVKSDYFLEPFRKFVPGSGPSMGSSFIWTTLASFAADFDKTAKKLDILLNADFILSPKPVFLMLLPPCFPLLNVA